MLMSASVQHRCCYDSMHGVPATCADKPLLFCTAVYKPPAADTQSSHDQIKKTGGKSFDTSPLQFHSDQVGDFNLNCFCMFD